MGISRLRLDSNSSSIQDDQHEQYPKSLPNYPHDTFTITNLTHSSCTTTISISAGAWKKSTSINVHQFVSTKFMQLRWLKAILADPIQ